jgi:hypothetical protein
MRTRIVMKEHYTGCQHSTFFVLNGPMLLVFFGVSQYTSDVIVVPCCMNSSISNLSSPRKPLASAFLQADNVYLNFIGLFGECVRIHCFDCFLDPTFRNEPQVSQAITRTM